VTKSDAYDGHQVLLTANATPGTSAVTYTIYKETVAADGTKTETSTGISQAVNYTVVEDSSIVDYKLDSAYSTLKTIVPYNASVSTTKYKTNYWDYAEWLTVHGETSSGATVILNTANVKAIYLDSTDFTLDPTTSTPTTTYTGADTTCHGVWACTFSLSTKTASSGTLTYSIYNSNDGILHTATSTVSSKTDTSVISSISAKVSTEDAFTRGQTGLSQSGTTITLNLANANAKTTYTALKNNYLAHYDTSGNVTGSPLFFYATDQYADDADIASITLSSYSFNGVTTGSLAVVSGNEFTTLPAFASLKSGDYIFLTATSANGYTQTMKITFTNTVTTTVATGVTGTESVTTTGVDAATKTAGVYTITLASSGNWYTGDQFTVDTADAIALAYTENSTAAASELADDINGDATLGAKYTAVASGKVVTLTQNDGYQSATAPVVSTTSDSGTVTVATTTAGVAADVTGATEVFTLTINSASAAAGTVTVTLNGTAQTITVTKSETAAAIATQIAGLTFTGYTATASGAVVTFTASAAGAVTTPVITVA